MKYLCLAPDGKGHGADAFYGRNYGERMGTRGAHYYYGTSAGIFALGLLSNRSESGWSAGFRAAYVE